MMRLFHRASLHRAARIALLVLVTLLGAQPSAWAQPGPAPSGDPVGCAGGSARTWTRFAGGPYPGRFRDARGIVLDAEGNLIVADSENGRLQRLTPTGAVLGIIDLPPVRPDLLPSPQHLAIDDAGNLYVADTAYHRVLKLTPDGRLLETIRPDPLEPRTREILGQIVVETELNTTLGAIAVGGGYLYLYATVWSGKVAHYFPPRAQMKRVDLRTGASVLLDTTNLVSPHQSRPSPTLFGLAADRDGTLYISEADQYRGAIRKVAPTGEVLALWADKLGEERLYQLSWITVSPDGTLYVSANGGLSVLALTRDGEFLGRWLATQARGLAVDRAGTIYVASQSWNGSGQIQKLAPTGETIARIGAPADAPGLLESVSGFDVDGADNVTVMTSPLSRQFVLQQFAPSGDLLGTGRLGTPTDMGYYSIRRPRLAPDGGLYALGPPYSQGDQIPRNAVVRLTADGEVDKIWQPDRQGTDSSVREAKDYVVAPNDTVYIADEQSVYKIGPDGRQQARWRAEDVDRWAPRGRTFTANALALDAAGNLYVGGAWFVYKLAPDGTVLARWGDGPADEYRSGPSTFSGINALVVDPAGNVYVSHSGTSLMTMLGPDGTVLASWGYRDERQRVPIGAFPGGSSLTLDRRGNVYAMSGAEIWRLACPAAS